jgi:hypothetical protein
LAQALPFSVRLDEYQTTHGSSSFDEPGLIESCMPQDMGHATLGRARWWR